MEKHGETKMLSMPAVTWWETNVKVLQALLNTKDDLRVIVLDSRNVLEVVARQCNDKSEANDVIDNVEDPQVWRDVIVVEGHFYSIIVSMNEFCGPLSKDALHSFFGFIYSPLFVHFL